MSNNCFNNCQFVQRCLAEQEWLFQDMDREEGHRIDDVLSQAVLTARHQAFNEWLDQYGYPRSRRYDKVVSESTREAERRETGYHTDMASMQNRAEGYGRIAEDMIQACENQGPHITKRWKYFGPMIMKCSSPAVTNKHWYWEVPQK